MADEDEILRNDLIARNLQVEELLAKGDKKAALIVCLSNPPVSTKSEELKVAIVRRHFKNILWSISNELFYKQQEANLLVVEKVLWSISEAEISSLLNGLNLDSCDVLMKYLYKIMGKFNNSSLMLKLHAQLIDKAGIGSIVRVLTDRKQV